MGSNKLNIPHPRNSKEYQREWRKLNPNYGREQYVKRREQNRESTWKRRYGINRADYEARLRDQGGACAICGTTEIGRGHSYFHVDHDHTTGKVRGLLCDLCNRGLGYFKDSTKNLGNAMDYLIRNA